MPLLDAKLDVDPAVLGKLASGDSKLWTAVVRDSSGAITDHIPIVRSGLDAAENMLSNNIANTSISQVNSNGFLSNAGDFVKQNKGWFIGGGIAAAAAGTLAGIKHFKRKKAKREQEERRRREYEARRQREYKEQLAREREIKAQYDFCNELSILLISYVCQAEKGEFDKDVLGQLIDKLQKAHELHVSGKVTIEDQESLKSLVDSITSLTEKLIEQCSQEKHVSEEDPSNADEFYFMKKELQKQYMYIDDTDE